MKSIGTTCPLFSFQVRDSCVKECRPLVDPLPPFMEAKPAASLNLSSSKGNSGGFCLNPETPMECSKVFGSPKQEIFISNEKPAGSPSFARRPIANGHFQRGSFKPSIRINQPPGGFGQIGNYTN